VALELSYDRRPPIHRRGGLGCGGARCPGASVSSDGSWHRWLHAVTSAMYSMTGRSVVRRARPWSVSAVTLWAA
jgi:hypothetical protein